MAENLGKKGEMRVVKLICDIVTVEGKCDFTRHTNTNTADSGADIVLEHKPELHDKLIGIASGNEVASSISSESNNSVKTRIDVKTTNSKISKGTVEKFGGDIRKNPDCNGHVLLGGAGLTKGAEKELASLKEAYEAKGKRIDYISNNGLENLESHYSKLPNPNADTDD